MGTRRRDEAVPELARLRRDIDEEAESGRFVHHVADLGTGRVLSEPLHGPPAPRSRAARLARLGHRFDDVLAGGGPSYRLTPSRPYQESPEASMIAGHPSFWSTGDDEAILWQLPEDLDRSLLAMRVSFAESPRERAIATIGLSAAAWPGAVGHIRLRESQSANEVRIPVGEGFAWHTVDLVFVPLGGRFADLLAFLEPGIRTLEFRWLRYGPVPPVLYPVSA